MINNFSTKLLTMSSAGLNKGAQRSTEKNRPFTERPGIDCDSLRSAEDIILLFNDESPEGAPALSCMHPESLFLKHVDNWCRNERCLKLEDISVAECR